MKAYHISWLVLCGAVGQLLVGVSNRDAAVVYASITAIVGCLLPSVFAWFHPDAPVIPSTK